MQTMKAMVIDGFGGPDQLRPHTMPVPVVADGEVLVRLEVVGVGEWDPFEREGGYAEMLGTTPEFPYVLGSEGAGEVAAVGRGVERLVVGDLVYAVGFLNPRGGFYAEQVVIAEDLVSRVPDGLTAAEAGVMGGVGTTALRGLDDVLHVEPGTTALVFGAGGGIGHLAVQLARRMGGRVLAVASGDDGVELASRLNADAVVDGRRDDVSAAARRFARGGIDAALLTAGGEAADEAVKAVPRGGRVAYPNGVMPEPVAVDGVDIVAYNGEPDRDLIERFDALISTTPPIVHIAETFPLESAAEAHRALERHHLGKLALAIS